MAALPTARHPVRDARLARQRRAYAARQAQLERAEDILGYLTLELDNASADDYAGALAAYKSQLAAVTEMRATLDSYDA